MSSAESKPSVYPFEMSTTVPADTGRVDPHTVETSIPYPARIIRVLIGYPSGTQQAVGVNVGRLAGEVWYPRGGVDNADFVAFDDRVIEFGPQEKVQEGEPIEANFINNDTNNDHFINVLVFAEER
jgi:hypothetical protein